MTKEIVVSSYDFPSLPEQPLNLARTGLDPRTKAEMLFLYAQRWRSPKAQINELLQLFPKDLLLLQTTVHATDEQSLKKAMQATINHRYPELSENCWAGLRTCFAQQSTNRPWIMGIQTEKQIRDFFRKRSQKPVTWQGSPDRYHDWLRKYLDRGLSEILVMTNYPRLGIIEHDPEFFVFRVFLDYNLASPLKKNSFAPFFSPAPVSLVLMPDTGQLRDLDEGTRRTSLIYYEPQTCSLNQPNYPISYGSKYLDSNGHPQPQVETLTQAVVRTVFQEWSQSYQLFPNLQALGPIGLEAIEFQGIKDENGQIKSMRIYGLRGKLEK